MERKRCKNSYDLILYCNRSWSILGNFLHRTIMEHSKITVLHFLTDRANEHWNCESGNSSLKVRLHFNVKKMKK